MLAAEVLGQALVASGIDTVFANPGTTELHLVDGFAQVAGLRQILTLFEGVASGAADGYARMTGRPAVALLHLGPGLGNSLANLHNARRAHSPVVALVGDHSTGHRVYDVPLQSDIAGIARSCSVSVRTTESASQLAHDGVAAVAAACDLRGVATHIVPADFAWAQASGLTPFPTRAPVAYSMLEIDAAAAGLRGGDETALIVGGGTLSAAGVAHLRAIAAATGATPMIETFLPRIRRGGGDGGPEVLPYFGDMAAARLKSFARLVLVGARHPAAFFAYPGQSGDCVAPGTIVHHVALGSDGLDAALAALADAVGAPEVPAPKASSPPAVPPDGPLTAMALGQTLSALLPDDAIVSDESNTTGPMLIAFTAAARPHDWLRLTGGAIGQGLPVATGAAVACPGRRVVALQSDGSALYTLQALWTQARERLDVTTVLLNNSSYAILKLEMMRLGLHSAEAATGSLFDLGSPPIDFVALATGFGVHAVAATTVAGLSAALVESFATPGPMLIDARLSA